MEAGFRTPFVDLFRRGEITSDIRLLAARGELTLRPHEQLALLVLLTGDADAEVAAAAGRTIDALPADSLAGLLASTDVTTEIREFFTARGLPPATASAPADVAVVTTAAGDDRPDDDAQPEGSALQKIAKMNVAQRVVLAMRGTREERGLLIRDPNKMVSMAVLSSPKMTDSEVESIAKMANVSEEVLRTIANTRAWAKNYAVTVALARNPKTPVAVSMNLLARLIDKDLRAISTDRNVPDILRVTARKKLVIDK